MTRTVWEGSVAPVLRGVGWAWASAAGCHHRGWGQTQMVSGSLIFHISGQSNSLSPYSYQTLWIMGRLLRERSLKALKWSLKAFSPNLRKPQELKPIGKQHKYFHCGFFATLFSCYLLHECPHWLLLRANEYHCRARINTTSSKQGKKDTLSVQKWHETNGWGEKQSCSQWQELGRRRFSHQ